MGAGLAREGAGAPAPPVDAGNQGSDVDVPMRGFDGVAVERLRSMLRVPQLHLFQSTGSTLDVAHRLGAAGAPHGTLVLADQQTKGRGRSGKAWSSPPGAGLWLTVLARSAVPAIPQVLTVRLGLAAAHILDRFAPSAVRIKWPNDLYLHDGKLAGVLVEARWRGSTLEWLAVGIGLNVTRAAPGSAGAFLGAGVDRVAVLQALMPALLAAIDRPEPALDADELSAFAARDLSRGRVCLQPVEGVVQGINAAAELLVRTADETVSVNSGSLSLAEGR